MVWLDRFEAQNISWSCLFFNLIPFPTSLIEKRPICFAKQWKSFRVEFSKHEKKRISLEALIRNVLFFNLPIWNSWSQMANHCKITFFEWCIYGVYIVDPSKMRESIYPCKKIKKEIEYRYLPRSLFLHFREYIKSRLFFYFFCFCLF
jgi:hypothetical protein